MDIKRLGCFTVLALAAGVSHADNFFVNTSLGASNYYPQPRYFGPNEHHSHTEALRFGYQWSRGRLSYGLETGYANMGHRRQSFGHNEGWENYVERIEGFMFGANLKYSLPMGFYISGRGGLLRSTDHQENHWVRWTFYPGGPSVVGTSKANASGVGSYVSLGVGYDFNKSFGLGLSYDRYRAHVSNDDSRLLFLGTSRVDTYTLTAEYRF